MKATTTSTPKKATEARPRVSRRVVAVGGVIGTAVVAALAAAVITPERIDAIVQIFAPSSQQSPPANVEYKRVVTSDGIFTMDIPTSWLLTAATYDVPFEGIVDAGVGAAAGEDPTDGRQPTEDGIYFAVSEAAASRFHLETATASTIQAWADKAALVSDWSEDGCVRGASRLSGPDGWVTGVTSWDNCYGVEGLRLWEMFSVPPGGGIVLSLQLQLTTETDESVLEHVIESLVINDSLITS